MAHVSYWIFIGALDVQGRRSRQRPALATALGISSQGLSDRLPKGRGDRSKCPIRRALAMIEQMQRKARATCAKWKTCFAFFVFHWYFRPCCLTQPCSAPPCWRASVWAASLGPKPCWSFPGPSVRWPGCKPANRGLLPCASVPLSTEDMRRACRSLGSDRHLAGMPGTQLQRECQEEQFW